ncbi:MerR family transcriptional regulator [Bacillus sp. AGMB 02131]|uniref:MerR family transcriptional regulator n=1 Tax=Peribacillus faecalis TaxID=2772559 RepID=A0A927CX10_9BACI|nr:MerR family transcriptional regulator [Peribacillus faecalis]MBD3109198.1 MerR family transcriptional regulator [Peribacillus faecalis]
MRTSEIAELSQVHPNTVRLYEEWHYISPVPRKSNGYRIFSDLHLKQMKIARLAFKQEFIQNNLRKKATNIVRLSGREQFKESLQAAESYLTYLQTEYEYALKSIKTVKQLLQNKSTADKTYSHKSVSVLLQLTEETLRNWERNHLYVVERNAQNRRIYTERDLQKLLVIRTLRSAHFSITSIAHLFRELEQSGKKTDILQMLQTPTFSSEFFHVTDDLINQIQITMNDVKSIIAILKDLQ